MPFAGYLDGLAGSNYTEMDGTTLGGKKHYEDMHNSDLVVNKDEFSFGGGDNKDSNDTGLEAGCESFAASLPALHA